MAGLYAFFGPASPERLADAARRLTFFSGEQVQASTDGGFSFAWVGHGELANFGPAFDPATGVRVISAGRVAWDEPDWVRAERMTALEGGLSNRLVLERYLRAGIPAVERQNGPAALLIFDPRARQIHLLTDHFGYQPVFLYRPDDPDQCIISTFADAIAGDSSASTTPDYTSMAEFLRAWRATPPHTYWREIKYAGAASHWVWSLGNRTAVQRHYWAPHDEPPFQTLEAATAELAKSLGSAVRIRTLPRLGPTVCFVSGGADSRVMLFGAADPASMIGVNIHDVPNQESRVARELCDRASVRYVGFSRGDDYYPRAMAEAARISGAMWSVEDSHFLGARQLTVELGARTVMTACTADWLFKGYGLEKRYRTLAGRNLPIKRFTHRRVEGFLPNIPAAAPAAFTAGVEQRMAEWFAGTPGVLSSDRDRLAVEDRRCRPACYAVSVSGQIMYRAFPYDTFLADRSLADCYSRIPARWKLNAEIWSAAVARLCARAGDTVDSNFGWKVGASTSHKLAVFGTRWVERRLRRAATVSGRGPATDGAWPDFRWYITNSRTLRTFWEGVGAEDRELMASLWGKDPWKTPLHDWTADANGLFRILTLLHRSAALQTRSAGVRPRR